MYYIEKVIDGVLCYQNMPNGPWHQLSKEALTAIILELQFKVASLEDKLAHN